MTALDTTDGGRVRRPPGGVRDTTGATRRIAPLASAGPVGSPRDPAAGPERGGRKHKQRADGTTLVCVYVAILFVLPSHLVVAAVPLALAPSMLVGMMLGLLWFCAQLVSTCGVAKGRSAVRTALFLFAISQLATYGYATYGYMLSDELNATDRSVITIMGMTLLGIMVVDSVRGLSRIDKLLRMIVYGLVFCAAIGLIQFFIGLDPTHYMTLPGLREVGSVETLLERSIFRRPSGTAGHPIEFGVVCAIGVPLAGHYGFRAFDRGLRSWNWWLCVVVLAIGALVSLSRSAILGLIAAGIVLLPTWKMKRALRTVLVAGVFTVVMRLFIPGLIGTLLSLFSNLSNDPSIIHRQEDYARADIQIAMHPWLGRGFGTYLPQRYGPLDNQYLGTLVETGYVGLAAMIFLLLASCYAVVRVRMATKDPVLRDLAQTLFACMVIFIAADATYDAFGFVMASGLFFLMAGICGALWRELRANPGQVMPIVEKHRKKPRGSDATPPRPSIVEAA